MSYKNVVATNGFGSFIVILENGMYACVSTKKGEYSKGISVMKHLEAFFKWGSFEMCSDEEVSEEKIEAIKYNLAHCEHFWFN